MAEKWNCKDGSIRGVFKFKRDYVNLTRIVIVKKIFTSYDFST
jgi:hypothetical protein